MMGNYKEILNREEPATTVLLKDSLCAEFVVKIKEKKTSLKTATLFLAGKV